MWYCVTCGLQSNRARAFCPADGDLLVNRGLPGTETGKALDGHYRLGNLLGEGGVGCVYEAEETSTGQRVAIKILKPGLAAPDAMRALERRLELEAETMSSLDHPAVARIIRLGSSDHEPRYMVMECLQGPNLDSVCRDPSVQLLQKLELIRDVCEAIGKGHVKGITHRDLKQSNIIVHRIDRDNFQVKVLDFGIAKVIGLEESLTRTGDVMGTPLFMSPEQLLGRKTIGPASDVYSLGVIIFTAIAGRAPFQAENLIELMRLHASRPVPSLSSFIEDVPQHVETIVQKCLSRRPENRYQNANDLAAALQECIEQASGCLPPALEPHETNSLSRSAWLSAILDDRYEISEWLASGRFGSEVFHASDIRLGRDVVVRLWDTRSARAQIAGARETLIDILRREAETIRARHANLISVLDMGHTDECVYLVTERVGGVSLREFIDQRGPIELEEVLELTIGTARGLAALHASGLTAGGFSLDSLRVVQVSDGGGSQLLLSPFGLLKLSELNRILDSSIPKGAERDEMLLLAPELGDCSPDPVSDVYSFGRVLLAMLDGSAATEDTEDMIIPLWEDHIRDAEEEHLSASLEDLPETWQQFLRKSLHQDPSHRFADGGALAEALALLR